MRRTSVLVLIAVAWTACARPAPATDGRRLRVVAAFYPLYEAAVAVTGDRSSVTNLTPPGSEPHDLEMAAPALDAVRDADVVVYLSGGFQPSLEKAMRSTRARPVDGLRGVDAPGGPDPHVWLDPAILSSITERVAQSLAEADPPGAAGYARRASRYRAALDSLDAEIRRGLARCARRELVTSHAAFGYFARRYGLTQYAISGIDPSADPNPKRLDELASLARSKQVTTIFTETLVSPKVARTLARETGTRTAVLDPIESAAPGQTYASLMRANLSALRAGLDCA